MKKLEKNTVITKTNSKKLLVSTMLIVLMLSSLASIASATSADNRTQVSPEDNPAGTSGDPTLYAPQDNVTTTSDDNPVLIQQRDNSTIRQMTTLQQTQLRKVAIQHL